MGGRRQLPVCRPLSIPGGLEKAQEAFDSAQYAVEDFEQAKAHGDGTAVKPPDRPPVTEALRAQASRQDGGEFSHHPNYRPSPVALEASAPTTALDAATHQAVTGYTSPPFPRRLCGLGAVSSSRSHQPLLHDGSFAGAPQPCRAADCWAKCVRSARSSFVSGAVVNLRSLPSTGEAW